MNGFGAYIGLPQKTNNGDQYVPISEKVYTIFATETGDVYDRMHVAMAAVDDPAPGALLGQLPQPRRLLRFLR